ncbi:hypothetical protein ABBQ32_008142 [Trebouxia sp. C0010 RCD-2024]
MQDSASSREHGAIGGSISGVEQKYAFRKLALGLVVSPEESSTSPFIVLMGWVSCGDKYLAKYNNLLSTLGYSSMRSVQPALTGFAIAETPRRLWAINMLEFLLETQRPDRPLVFWAFSNGGCWVFEQLLPLLQYDSRYQPIKDALAGLIFDSAPCYMTPGTGSQALTAGLAFPLKQLLQALFLMIWVPINLVLDIPKRFWRRMVEETLAVPRLYLYSTDDHLCHAGELEALLETKRSQGLDITVKKWDHSAHCAHLRSHPKEYVAALQAFLAKVSKS